MKYFYFCYIDNRCEIPILHNRREERKRVSSLKWKHTLSINLSTASPTFNTALSIAYDYINVNIYVLSALTYQIYTVVFICLMIS